MANWISLQLYLEKTGFKYSTFRGWKRHLVKGKHYNCWKKNTVVNVEELDKWLAQGGPQASDLKGTKLESKSGKMGSSTIQRPSKVVPIQKLTLKEQ